MALKPWLAWMAAILLGLDQVSIADGMGLRAIAEKTASAGNSGQSLPRMTSTLKPLSKENRCKFCFYVGMDEKGFVIANGGSNVHCHHPRLCEDEISYPTNLLSTENLSAITDLAHSNTNLGVAVNFVKYRTGKVLNRNKIRWLRGLCNDLRSIPNLPKKDSTEIMTQYLIEKK